MKVLGLSGFAEPSGALPGPAYGLMGMSFRMLMPIAAGDPLAIVV